ncbi:TorD/DmsD family molecular chaperone [Raoultibacter massiliensis]|uniref:TorD/DmsD family molecular chaperone n=1 Tax=Raoultibacter massiliensis TaxID=1852371 RepID=UPI003A8ED9F0
MIQNEETHAILAARHYLYALFHGLFGVEPSEAFFSSIDHRVAREAFGLVFECGSDDELLAADLVDLLERDGRLLGELRAEYTRLFIGPGALPVSPWESVHVTKEEILFNEVTLEVRDFYRRFGFLPEGYPRVADDHIALELDFLTRLAAAALDSYAAEERECGRILSASVAFLNAHLGVWVGEFASGLRKREGNRLYSLAARVLEAFVEQDVRAIGGILNG